MSNWNGLGSSWQYSRWVKNLARNARITNPTSTGIPPENYLYRIAVDMVCDTSTIPATGTRPWLANAYYRLSVTGTASQYEFSAASEPIAVIVKAMEVVGRDLKKIPITNFEKALFDVIFAYTNNRRYGTTPYFGGVGGSTVGVP